LLPCHLRPSVDEGQIRLTHLLGQLIIVQKLVGKVLGTTETVYHGVLKVFRELHLEVAQGVRTTSSPPSDR
jgi:hypothetical protein